MEQAQEQSEAQSQSFCRKQDKSVNTLVVQQMSARLQAPGSPPSSSGPSSDERVSSRSRLRNSSWGKAVFRSSAAALWRWWRCGRSEGQLHPCDEWRESLSDLHQSPTDAQQTASLLYIIFLWGEVVIPHRNVLSLAHRLCISAADPKWTSWNMGPLLTWARPKWQPLTLQQTPWQLTASSASHLWDVFEEKGRTELPATPLVIFLKTENECFTREVLSLVVSLVRQREVSQHVLDLLLGLRLRATFQQWVE